MTQTVARPREPRIDRPAASEPPLLDDGDDVGRAARIHRDVGLGLGVALGALQRVAGDALDEAGGLEDRRGRRRTLRSDRVGGSRPSRRHPCLAREIGREGALAGHRRRRRGLGGGDPEGQDREREAESGGHRTAQQTEHREDQDQDDPAPCPRVVS